MKFKYFFIIILLLAGILQFNRIMDKGKYFSVKQEFTFEKAPAKNTTLTFENPQKYLIFYNPSSKVSKDILYNLEKTFEFTKAEFDIVKITDTPDISKYDYFIFVTDNFLGFKKIIFEDIKEKLLSKGGTLFILANTEYNPFNEVAGIDKINRLSDNEHGINFTRKIFPGIDSFSPGDTMLSSSVYDVSLAEDVSVLAKTNNNLPLIWEKNLGKGRIIYTNSNFFEGNIVRGLMNQIISYGSDWYINPILNSKLIQIDDFPSPVPRYNNETIRKSYGMDTGDFYNKIWWKDMVALSERRNLIFSGFIIIDYNNNIHSSDMKEIPKITLLDLDKRARELLLYQGEIGIHGYNHNPLVFEGDTDFKALSYVPWDSDADIVAGLKNVSSTVENLLGKNIKLYSYVPPSNILKERGEKDLLEAFPDLKTISSIFYGDESKGAFVTEVGRDEKFPSIYTMPRFSSGFSYDKDDLWGIFNALAVYGYMSHFVHPDDVISDDRGFGKDWNQLYHEFEKVILEVEKRFPYLEPSTDSGLTQKYMNIEDLKIHSEKDGNTLKIGLENFRNPFSALVRIRHDDIKSISSGEYRLVNKYGDNSIYLIKFTNENTIIELGKKTGEIQ